MPYSVSKTALLGLTKALSFELSPDNIRVNCVAPGIIDTKFAGAVSWSHDLPHQNLTDPCYFSVDIKWIHRHKGIGKLPHKKVNFLYIHIALFLRFSELLQIWTSRRYWQCCFLSVQFRFCLHHRRKFGRCWGHAIKAVKIHDDLVHYHIIFSINFWTTHIW